MNVELLFVAFGIFILVFGALGYGLKQKPFSVKPVLSEETTSPEEKIPKVVYQTFKTKDLTPSLQKVRENNIKISPTYRFELWDDSEIDRFISSHFPQNVYRAFKKINPKFGAAKADFWRYCVLYINGGIYMDIKTELKKDLEEVIRAGDRAILDIPRVLEPWRDGTYEQWFLAFEPKHPYLKATIQLITDRISSGYVPRCVSKATESSCPKQKILKLTGPDAYTEAIEYTIEKQGVAHRTIPFDEFVSYGNDQAKRELYAKTSAPHYSEVEESLYVW